ncbi:MAG: sulfite exporter TauE/SafE family protein [Alphaproteobacteria bacterium]|nr:sulfite exporter TauE/SafE family protein [Alphaproteobacteria bacterium]
MFPLLSNVSDATILLISLSFFSGGLSKGAVGIGLPLVSLPFIAIMLPPLQAIALLVVPVISTNIFQVFHQGLFVAMARRYWSLILTIAVTAILASRLIVSVDNEVLLIAIGFIIAIIGLMRVIRLPVGIPDRHEVWLNPLIGLVSGLVGSVSNLFGPPVFAYLSMRGITKDSFIVVIAMVFLVGAIPLHANLFLLGVTTPEILILSALTTIPVVAGMALGTWLRARFSQAMFEKILVTVIVVAGLNLIRRGLF